MTNRDYTKGVITCVCGTEMSFVWEIRDAEEDDALCPVCETILIRAPIPFTKNNGWHPFKDKAPELSQIVWLYLDFLCIPNVRYSDGFGFQYWVLGDNETVAVSPEDYWMPFTNPPGPGTPKKDFTG